MCRKKSYKMHQPQFEISPISKSNWVEKLSTKSNRLGINVTFFTKFGKIFKFSASSKCLYKFLLFKQMQQQAKSDEKYFNNPDLVLYICIFYHIQTYMVLSISNFVSNINLVCIVDWSGKVFLLYITYSALHTRIVYKCT